MMSNNLRHHHYHLLATTIAVLGALFSSLLITTAYAQPQQPTQSKACPEGFELNKRGFCEPPQELVCPQGTNIIEFEGVCYFVHYEPQVMDCPIGGGIYTDAGQVCSVIDEEGNVIGTVDKVLRCSGGGSVFGNEPLPDGSCIVVDDEFAKVPGGCPEGTREDASGNCIMRPGRK